MCHKAVCLLNQLKILQQYDLLSDSWLLGIYGQYLNGMHSYILCYRIPMRNLKGFPLSFESFQMSMNKKKVEKLCFIANLFACFTVVYTRNFTSWFSWEMQFEGQGTGNKLFLSLNGSQLAELLKRIFFLHFQLTLLLLPLLSLSKRFENV